MTYTSKNKWVDYVIFGLSVFLVFCLLFDSYIELPRLVAWIGRWHPVVLHFPIVLLLICVFLGLTGRKTRLPDGQVPRFLLTLAVIFALVTAISGFFLGKEIDTKGDLLYWHQWLGGTLALLAALWYWLEGMQLENRIYTKVLQVALIGLVLFTGHYGGMVTHGEDFLALPTEKREEKIPENPLIYKDVVGRILDNNCVSCHNPNKQKGDLLMTSLDELLKGGEVGNTIVLGNPEESEIIRRLHLPFDDEEHMPPDGKKPLDETEIRILERWIALGASDTLRLAHIGNSEPLADLVKSLMEPDPAEKWAKFPQVADSTLQNLSSDYLTIKRVAGNSNALSIDVYMPPEYDPKAVTNLRRVAENIVELDLSGLPIGKEEIALIAASKNLEWLEIDKTPVTDSETDTLRALSKLHTLKIFETAIGDKSLLVFREMSSLKSIYLWETSVSKEAVEQLKTDMPLLKVNSGIDEELRSFFIEKDSVPEI